MSLEAETRMSVSVSNNLITVSSVGNIGDNEEECECVSDKEFKFNVNWHYLSDALKNIEGEACLVYTSPNRPLVIKPKDGNYYLSILALMN